MNTAGRRGALVGTIVFILAALGLVVVGIVNQAPAFIIMGAAIAVVGVTTMGVLARRSGRSDDRPSR